MKKMKKHDETTDSFEPRVGDLIKESRAGGYDCVYLIVDTNFFDDTLKEFRCQVIWWARNGTGRSEWMMQGIIEDVDNKLDELISRGKQ